MFMRSHLHEMCSLNLSFMLSNTATKASILLISFINRKKNSSSKCLQCVYALCTVKTLTPTQQPQLTLILARLEKARHNNNIKRHRDSVTPVRKWWLSYLVHAFLQTVITHTISFLLHHANRNELMQI